MARDDDFIPLEGGDEVHDVADDQLLADAIPIDSLEEEDSAPASPPPPPRKAPPPPAADGESVVIEPIDLADDDDEEELNREIRTFDKGKKVEDEGRWAREADPNARGATRCRTFVAKLRLDAIEHLDEQINDWLDSHPQYTVKCVTTSVGVLTGKVKEEALFVNVFV